MAQPLDPPPPPLRWRASLCLSHLRCPSFPCFFCFHLGNLQFYQGFSFPAEGIKTLKKKRENAHCSKETPCSKSTKEIQTIKEAKDRVCYVVQLSQGIALYPPKFGLLQPRGGAAPNGPMQLKTRGCDKQFDYWATPPVRLGLSGRNSGKIPERPRKRSQSVSWNFPREYGWDAPNPRIQGI